MLSVCKCPQLPSKAFGSPIRSDVLLRAQVDLGPSVPEDAQA